MNEWHRLTVWGGGGGGRGRGVAQCWIVQIQSVSSLFYQWQSGCEHVLNRACNCVNLLVFTVRAFTCTYTSVFWGGHILWSGVGAVYNNLHLLLSRITETWICQLESAGIVLCAGTFRTSTLSCALHRGLAWTQVVWWTQNIQSIIVSRNSCDMYNRFFWGALCTFSFTNISWRQNCLRKSCFGWNQKTSLC